MLDQNTDRMWYVIGAVLVGAAIILIANGTMPEIFASVTGSFDEVSSVAMEGVEDVYTPSYGDNIIKVSKPLTYGIDVSGKGWTEFNEQFKYGNEILKHNTTYRFTANVKMATDNKVDHITVAPVEWLRTGIGNTQLYNTVPISETNTIEYEFTTDNRDYGFIVYAGTYNRGMNKISSENVGITLSNYSLVEVLK